MRMSSALLSLALLLAGTPTATTAPAAPDTQDRGMDYVWAFQGDVAFFEKDGKIGLTDSEYHVLHDAAFDEVNPFDQNGLAKIIVDGRTGRINRAGEIVVEPIACEYMGYLEYHSGFTELRDEVLMYRSKVIWDGSTRIGFIALDGRLISRAQWEDSYSFVNGFAYVKKDGKWNMIDLNGDLLLDSWWDSISIGARGTATLSNSQASIKIGESGEIAARYEIDADGNSHLVMRRGVPYSGPYDDQWAISETRSIYRVGELYGLLDEDGAPLTDVVWGLIFSSDAPDGLLCVKNDRNGNSPCGWIDMDGETVLETEWTRLRKATENRWVARNENGEFWIFDDRGEMLHLIGAESEYRYAYATKDGYIRYATTDGYWGFMDSEGVPLCRVDGDEVWEEVFGEYSEGWTQVELADESGGYLYVDGTLLSNPDWKGIRPFHNGYACVEFKEQDDYKWGFIDTTGALVIPAVWDGSGEYEDWGGMLLAGVGMRVGDEFVRSYINEQGETVCGIKQER